MARTCMLALLSLALLAASPLAVRAAHHGEDGDDVVVKGSGKYNKDGPVDPSEVVIKTVGTTYSLGSKWPITNSILGCLEYDADAQACVTCLEPFFTLTEDGVCDCAEGYGLAPFAYSAKTQSASSHAPKPKLMVCAPCPLGTFSDGGAYSTTLCERCPTGSTTPTPVSTSADDCTLCQTGFAGSPPDTPCKLCPAGSYADPDDNAVCTPCPEGFTTPKAGMTTEDACYIAVCDVDQQSIKGECYDCAEGYFADQGNALFGKYQPKCTKISRPYKNHDVHLARGKQYEGAEGYLAEPKESDKDFVAPKASTKEPKLKSLAINAKAGGKYDDAPIDG